MMEREREGASLEQFEDTTRMSLLFDYYGQLLTEKQQDIFRLYHEENLTLGEIAAEWGISRQGVHDALKKAEHALGRYEESLHLVSKYSEYQKTLLALNKAVQAILAEEETRPIGALRDDLRKISDIIASLDI
jgi:predicted DNA-binding protein YlxM (UPF0122 family)